VPTQPPEVHQAEGILMVQLNSSIDAAAERLSAYAVENDRPVIDVAEDILAHRLNLSNATDSPL
jgi:AmiR/NasT family two-component response regulator